MGASLPENAGRGAGVRCQQHGEHRSLLVQAIRVLGRLPGGLACAHPGCRGQEGRGSEEKASHRRIPVSAGKPNGRLRKMALLEAREYSRDGAERNAKDDGVTSRA